MLKSIRQASRDSIIYSVGNIAVKIVGFILIPLYTDPRYFSVDDFGIIALLDITGLVIISAMASGLPQSLLRWYWDKDYSANQKGIFFMTLVSQVAVGLLFCLILFPLSHNLSDALFKTTDWSNTIKLLILSSALQAVNNLINTLMRIQLRSVLYTIANISKLTAVLLLTIYFIVFRDSGVTGIYIAQVVGNSLFILLLSGYTIKNCKPFFNFQVLKSMSRFGFPLLLANFASSSLTVIDRYALNSLALLKYVALYSLAYKISSVLKLVIVDSIRLAVFPMVMKKIDTPGNKRFYSKTMLYSSFVLMLGIIAISLFSFEIIGLITRSREFLNAYSVVPLLAISVFFVNMREISSFGLYIVKKTNIIGINVVVAAVINILLNIILIPKWNITGAALATIITQVIYLCMNYIKSQKEYYIPFEQGKLALLLLLGSIISFSGLLMTELNLVLRLTLKLLCLVSFPFILYLFDFYEPVEIQTIRKFFNKWKDLSRFRENLKTADHLTDDE